MLPDGDRPSALAPLPRGWLAFWYDVGEGQHLDKAVGQFGGHQQSVVGNLPDADLWPSEQPHATRVHPELAGPRRILLSAVKDAAVEAKLSEPPPKMPGPRRAAPLGAKLFSDVPALL